MVAHLWNGLRGKLKKQRRGEEEMWEGMPPAGVAMCFAVENGNRHCAEGQMYRFRVILNSGRKEIELSHYYGGSPFRLKGGIEEFITCFSIVLREE